MSSLRILTLDHIPEVSQHGGMLAGRFIDTSCQGFGLQAAVIALGPLSMGRLVDSPWRHPEANMVRTNYTVAGMRGSNPIVSGCS